MESAFCLIGFSGDDPNFLHWSGWVRDNLGKAAPKIYLAGWLDLSSHRRRMLEDRNVVPIDLARHPKAESWPEHLRHRKAIDWVLHTLEHGKPYDVIGWPSPRNWQRSPVPEDLQPVEEVTVNEPEKEPELPTENKGIFVDEVREVIRVWEQNRKVYPGWLFIPPQKHLLINHTMDRWEIVILSTLPDFQVIERLSILRELIWRRENMLEPLSEELEKEVEAVLGDIDCQVGEISGTKSHNVNWISIREAWRELGMVLLTAARHRFDCNAFDTRLAALLPFLNDHPNVAQALHHEKCLWALHTLDFVALDKLLKEWCPENCDPIWMTRKAAILVEIDKNDEAIRLLNCSLQNTRESTQIGDSLASPSRESWTLLLALTFKGGFSRSVSEEVEVQISSKRWRKLAALECDAYAQKQLFFDWLKDDYEKESDPLFDLGARRGNTTYFFNKERRRWSAARQAVRLCDVAGLPPSALELGLASGILKKAASILMSSDIDMSLHLALRLASSGQNAIFNRIWMRSRIAALSAEKVDTLVNLITNVITYAIPKATDSNEHSRFWSSRLQVGMEALSRLVLRLPPERAEDILYQGLSYYRMDGLAKKPWGGESIKHLLTRSWEALPEQNRTNLVIELLNAPIAGLDGFEPFRHFFPDPGELIDERETRPPERTPETEARWIEIIQLVIRGLRTGGEARKRAALRMIPLIHWDCITASEKDLIAKALWCSDQSTPVTLPSETTLLDWVFLLMPEPETGLAEKLFRKKWLSPKDLKDEEALNEHLFLTGCNIAGLRTYKRPFILTEDECSSLAILVKDWIALPVTSEVKFLQKWGTREGIIGLQSILPQINLSSFDIAEDLFDKIGDLNQTNTPGFKLFSALSKFLSDRIDEIATSMRMGLSSDNAVVAEDAVFGLNIWLGDFLRDPTSVLHPPHDLLKEIGVIIATRRKGVLHRALMVARLIFSRGNAEQQDIIAQSTLYGLRYLIEELGYDREHDEKDELDIPLLRWDCAHLALAMSAAGYETEQTVISWIEVAQKDPLPEVRHAEKSVSLYEL